MALTASDGRSVSRYVLLRFGLCIPVWVIGAIFDVQLFPGFKLFQAGLAMPMVASLLLTYRERRWAGTAALLRRTYDVSQIRPRVWFLPILLVFPSVGVIKALCHWTFGLFWILWPQDNLQKAVPFYQPHIAAVAALLYVLVVACAWGPRRWRVGDSRAPGSAHPVLV